MGTSIVIASSNSTAASVREGTSTTAEGIHLVRQAAIKAGDRITAAIRAGRLAITSEAREGE